MSKIRMMQIAGQRLLLPSIEELSLKSLMLVVVYHAAVLQTSAACVWADQVQHSSGAIIASHIAALHTSLSAHLQGSSYRVGGVIS